MTCIVSVTILFCIVYRFQILAQSNSDSIFSTYLAPEKSNKSLFYLQRNKNANTVVYEANTLADGTLNPDNPINVFWNNFSEKNEKYKRDLNWIEKTIGYGIKVRNKINGQFWLSFVADNSRGFFIYQDITSKKIHAQMKLNNEWAILEKIYIYARETSFLPKVSSIHIYGKNISTGKDVIEKIVP